MKINRPDLSRCQPRRRGSRETPSLTVGVSHRRPTAAFPARRRGRSGAAGARSSADHPMREGISGQPPATSRGAGEHVGELRAVLPCGRARGARGRLLMVCLLDREIAAPTRSSLPSCSRPSIGIGGSLAAPPLGNVVAVRKSSGRATHPNLGRASEGPASASRRGY
jgi:hypothetical protein